MKIAVTSENNQVFQHFGHTPGFSVFTCEDGKIIAREELASGETGHGALAGLLNDNGIELLICGGIGGGAQTALANAGIRLIGGASGNIDEVVAAYLAGNLKVNADFHCHHHDNPFGHSCGSHDCGSHSCSDKK